MKKPKLTELMDNVKVTEWYMLGLHLDNDEREMDFIKKDDKKAALQETFQLWLKTCPKPTWLAIVAALKKISQNYLASKVEEKFC